jgi:hypothetical protein
MDLGRLVVSFGWSCSGVPLVLWFQGFPKLLKYCNFKKNILPERELNNIIILLYLIRPYCALVKVDPIVP